MAPCSPYKRIGMGGPVYGYHASHLKDILVLFGFEGSALSIPLFLFSHVLSLFFDNGKGPLYGIKYGAEWPGVPMCL